MSFTKGQYTNKLYRCIVMSELKLKYYAQQHKNTQNTLSLNLVKYVQDLSAEKDQIPAKDIKDPNKWRYTQFTN